MKENSLLKGNAVFEKYIRKNFLKYIVIFTVYLIGFLIGIVIFNSYINNEANASAVSQYILQIVEELGVKNVNALSSYIRQDFLELIFMIALSFSLVGVPIIIVSFFIDSISIGITISALIHSIGVGSGLSFSILMFLIPVILKIVVLLAIVCSSLKFTENILKYKKEIKYELIRHAVVCIIAFLVICIVALYRNISFKIIIELFFD